MSKNSLYDVAKRAFDAYQRAGGLDVAAMSVALDVAFRELPVVGSLYQHAETGKTIAVLDGEDSGSLRHETKWARVGALHLRRGE